MQYAVTFTLTRGLRRPAGVLRSSATTTCGSSSIDTLVCDIGGVHSSVGEYVNLWNYIGADRTEDEQHTLTFFYTERGASGSTCYMNFTLPSVSGVTHQADDRRILSVGKEVRRRKRPDQGLYVRQATFGDANSSRIRLLPLMTRTAFGSQHGQRSDVFHSGQTVYVSRRARHIRVPDTSPSACSYELRRNLTTDGYSVTNTVNGVV